MEMEGKTERKKKPIKLSVLCCSVDISFDAREVLGANTQTPRERYRRNKRKGNTYSNIVGRLHGFRCVGPGSILTQGGDDNITLAQPATKIG